MWVNKKNSFCLFLTLMSFVCKSQTTTIPDANFEQALIDLGYDTAPINGFVLTANISAVTNLDVSLKNISNLTGIEDFVALEILYCNDNQLASLNITQNTKLIQLFCNNNQLSSIDVSKNLDLNIFWCFNNRFSSLDVTKNISLISLVCNDNNLSNLIVTNNVKLNVLVIDNNQLSTIDVTKNPTLNRFQCGNNLLSNLDVSKNSNLSFLSCESNVLSSLDVRFNPLLITLNCQFNQLSELDASKNNTLAQLNCSNNALCTLNLKNGNNTNTVADFRANINLNCVVVDNPANNHATWMPSSFSNYVSTQNDCNYFVNVDTLESVITNTSYTLPALTYGYYFTMSGGNGSQLSVGAIISTSQTIYIYNESVCATNESSFKVLITTEDYYIPKYFTPNNDGAHDFWKVQDFKNAINTITIFDRYGKLLKFLPANSTGWNGVFNGVLMETNTYWYVIALNTGETIKGYFALKR